MNTPLASPDAIAAADSKASGSGYCGNCGTALLGPYCYACGQPRKGWIRKISGILADFVDTVFDLDSRTFRTLTPLYFRPGFLTCEYFAGRRVRYVTPLRLYFFLSVLAFFAVGVLTPIATDAGGAGLKIEINGDSARPDQRAEELRQGLRTLKEQRPHMPALAFAATEQAIQAELNHIERSEEKVNSESAKAQGPTVDSPPVGDSPIEGTSDPNPNGLRFFGSRPWHPQTNPLHFGALGVAGNRWLNNQAAVIVANAEIARKHPDRLLNQMLVKAPQVLFVLLPVFALLLKCLYLFKRRLYMEHLIVALHSHSFLSLSILTITILGALAAMLPEAGLLARLLGVAQGLAWTWVPLYLLIAHKRIYQQGWFFTLLKFGVVGLSYTVLISAGMVLNILFSLATL